METNKIDLKEFKRQKDSAAKQAMEDCAEKIVQINSLINEIGTLVELTGIQVKLNSELENAIYEVDKHHPEWNSSSYNC